MQINCYLSGNEVHDRVVRAFAEGCGGRLIDDWEYDEPDVAVVFGVYKKRVPISWARGGIIAKHKAAGRQTVILETGYVRRGDGPENYYAAGLDGLNGRADFGNKNVGASRWEELGVKLKPWREHGDHVLLCGQIPWDASVQHIDLEIWLDHISEQVKPRMPEDCTLRYRAHPLLNKSRKPVMADEVSSQSLGEDLKDAWCVVTFNSNTAVDALIAGVPAFAFDEGSMAHPIADNAVSHIKTPETPDRQSWANRLAYTQWTPREMEEGKAFAHLFGGMNDTAG